MHLYISSQTYDKKTKTTVICCMIDLTPSLVVLLILFVSFFFFPIGSPRSQDYVLVISAMLINRNMHCHVRSLRKSRNHPVFYPFSLALSTPVPTKHACVLANSNNRWRAGGGGQGAQLECSGGRGAGEGEMGKGEEEGRRRGKQL